MRRGKDKTGGLLRPGGRGRGGKETYTRNDADTESRSVALLQAKILSLHRRCKRL